MCDKISEQGRRQLGDTGERAQHPCTERPYPPQSSGDATASECRIASSCGKAWHLKIDL